MRENQTLVANLEESWPNVKNGNNMRFWEHEWNKHGRCSEQTFGQIQYFQRADAIWRNARLNIAAIFKNNRISTGGAKHSYSAIEKPIMSAIQSKPLLRCKDKKKSDPKTREKIELLLEVVTCWSHDGQNMINCTSNSTDPQKCSSDSIIMFL